MASSLKVVNNATYRPIKSIAETSAYQLEYNGNNLTSVIFCKAAVAIKAKDNGVLLIALTSRAADVGGFDKLPFTFDDEGEVSNPQVVTMWLHASKYQVYDFKAGARIDIDPSDCEKAYIDWLVTNDKLNKVFKGKFAIETTYTDAVAVAKDGFMGNWSEGEIPPQIAKVISEYETGSESGKGKGEYKTYQQKMDERIKAIAPLAWEIAAKPGEPMPTDLALHLVAFRALSSLDDVQLKAIDLMLPKS